MSAQVLLCSRARLPLCSSCLLSRCTRVYYSQPALSSVAGYIQDSDASGSANTNERTRTTARNDSQHALVNTRDPLDPSRFNRYLSSIGTANLEPTLDDIERCKPANFSRPDSSRYAAEYTSLLETLCRSFSKDQLRRFTELYKLDPIWTRSSRRKTEYAESIMEKAWGWPSLKEIERKRRDTTEVLVNSYAVTPSQLFLIMGKDGADLLQLSMQYNVHISLTANPLSLRVEGLRGSLKGLTEYISTLKKGMVDEIFELPTGRPVQQDLLQRISRLSGAYVENHGNKGKIRICAKDASNITIAKQLALRTSLEAGTQAQTVCYDPPSKIKDSPIEICEPRRYSIYPFVVPSLFPWTMHPGGAFRARRVVDWLGANSCEDITSTGGLADNSHHLLSLDQNGEELSQLVSPTKHEGASNHRRIITASPGHVLMSAGDKSQRLTMFPPLRGTLSLPELLKWVGTSGTSLNFVPSVSPAVMTATLVKPRVIHRLIYRTLPHLPSQVLTPPQLVLSFEIELSDGDLENERVEDPSMSNELNWGAGSFLSQKSVSEPGCGAQALNRESDSNCQVGTETYFNVMFPDRPMDMQLCVFDHGITLVKQPQALRDYANKLRDFFANKERLPLPDPPLAFDCGGRAYYLHEGLSVKQRNNSIALSSISSDCHTDDLVEVYSESIMDLQSAEKREVCQVKLMGTVVEGPGWRRFLAACDQLTTMSLKSQSRKEKPHTDHLEKLRFAV